MRSINAYANGRNKQYMENEDVIPEVLEVALAAEIDSAPLPF